MNCVCISPAPPVVDLTADRLLVGEGGTVILTCNVTSGNPKSYTYMWTHVTSSEVLTGATSSTLTLSGVTMDSVGTYRCAVTNGIGTGMDSITIELGGQPH